MNSIVKFYKWCTRYFSFTLLILLSYLVYMLFFNENSVMKAFELNRTIDSLQTEIEMNRDSMEYYQNLNEQLATDPQAIERVVRENYNMNRSDEDVYVFEAKEEK